MTEYRIKKGGREFTATRLETLKELLRRDLLRPSDPVSVDGGDFVSIGDIDGLQETIQELAGEQSVADAEDESDAFALPSEAEDSSGDPWRHWSDFEMDEDEADTSEDGVLASFLDQIDVTESGTFQVLRRSHPKVAAVARRSHPKVPVVAPPSPVAEPETPPESEGQAEAEPPRVVVADRIEPVEVTEDDLESIESLPPVLPDEADPEPEESAPKAPLTSVAASPTSSPAVVDEEAATQAMIENPALPVSFRDWLQRNESGQSGERLERFGRYDDGIVKAAGPPGSRFNLFRVLVSILMGCVLIASYYLWIRTSAESSFPPESEVEKRMPGAVGLHKPSAQLASIDSPVGSSALQLPPEELERRARELSVRQRVRSAVADFTSSTSLEDALFQELTNSGAKPISVRVEPLGEVGSRDKYNRRPTTANLTVQLGAISESGDRGFEVLEERLIYTWLLVGKYATLGRISFEDVELTVQPPLAWNQRYEGRELGLLWEQQIQSEDLFPEED